MWPKDSRELPRIWGRSGEKVEGRSQRVHFVQKEEEKEVYVKEMHWDQESEGPARAPG